MPRTEDARDAALRHLTRGAELIGNGISHDHALVGIGYALLALGDSAERMADDLAADLGEDGQLLGETPRQVWYDEFTPERECYEAAWQRPPARADAPGAAHEAHRDAENLPAHGTRRVHVDAAPLPVRPRYEWWDEARGTWVGTPPPGAPRDPTTHLPDADDPYARTADGAVRP